MSDIVVSDEELPPMSQEVADELSWRVENSPSLDSLKDFVKRTVGVIKENNPKPVEVTELFDKGEMIAVNSILVRWEAFYIDTNNRWRFKSDYSPKKSGQVKVTTGNTTTIHWGSSDMIPTEDVKDIKNWVVVKIQEEPKTQDQLMALFEKEYGINNYERLAKAMDELNNSGEVIIDNNGRWEVF